MSDPSASYRGPDPGPPPSQPSSWGEAPRPGPGPQYPGSPPQGPVPWGQPPRPAAWGPQYEAPPVHWSPNPPPAPGGGSGGYTRRSQATTAMVFSLAGLLCCGLFSIVGLLMARSELDAMNHGETDPAHRTRAEAAFAVGILGTVIALGMLVLWLFIIGAARTGTR